ncbi:glycosyltransferase [Jannaschia sp. M317]|uniref:glycosyltransferase n=1 Tax=Jannaschia sp. M317 TaxID=2867011 RepID=UPI0021A3D9A5|nr:glycosyltransferase [Jannaschia sp. M317]UWQ16359.1 glycosyltransferase [Jannaschia sp. M317]
MTPPPQWSGVKRLPGLTGRIPRPRNRAVVLSSLGSLGDLYPVLSLARALEARGVEPRLALSPDDCERARDWGLLASPVGPSEADVCRALQMTREEIAAAVLRDPSRMMSHAMMPLLPGIARQVADLCSGAGCVTGTTFALGASLAAEMTGTAYVPLLLQPMMTFSADDPPVGPAFRLAIKKPRTRLGVGWNKGLLSAARWVLRQRHSAELTRLRADLGLGPQPGTPLFDHGATVPLRLGLWSPRFAPLAQDAPAGLQIAGFPPAPEGDLPRAVLDWIGAGPPPLIVTRGSIAHDLEPETFWQEAIAMARTLGLRAVLLHGKATVPEGPDLLPLRYAAHAPLFPLGAAVLHHGGIGTTAEALRAGRPQLVVPVGGDQPDNAARLERLGVARSLSAKRFSGARGAAALTELLERFDYNAVAALARTITEEDGAAFAARLLERIVIEG